MSQWSDPVTSAQMSPGTYADTPSPDEWRRYYFWCTFKKREVEVEFATKSFLGLPRTVGVMTCTAFDQPRNVACRRRCVDSRFRGQWPAALPVMDRRRGLEI